MRLPAVVRLAAAVIAIFACMAQAAGTAEPRRYDYRQSDGRSLSAYVGRRQERFLRAHGFLSPIIDEKTSAP